MKRMSLLWCALLLAVAGLSGCGVTSGKLTPEQEARRAEAWLRLQDSLTRVGTSALTAAEAAMIAKINEELKVEASGK